MKNKTTIMTELRALGCKFSQPQFMEDMQDAVVEFQHNHVVLYADNTTNILAGKYGVPTKEPKKPAANKAVEGQPDIAAIKRMLEAICKDLNIAVH